MKYILAIYMLTVSLLQGATHYIYTYENATNEFKSVRSGDTVVFKNGTHIVSERIDLVNLNSVVIKGEAGSKINLAKGGNKPGVFYIQGCTSLKISNLTIDGGFSPTNASNSDQSTKHNLPFIEIKASTATRIENSLFRNHWKPAIVATQANGAVKNTTIHNCDFYFVGNGHDVTGNKSDRKQAIAFSRWNGNVGDSTGNVVSHCYFEDIGLDCISFSEIYDSDILHNVIRGNDAGSIYVSRCNDINIEYNNVRNDEQGGNGIDIINSSNILVYKNTCYRNGAAGILIAGASTNISLEYNKCYNNFRSSLTATPSVHRGGITISKQKGNSSTPYNVTLSGNNSFNTSSISTTASQEAGVYWYSADGFSLFNKILILSGNTISNFKRSDGKNCSSLIAY